MTSVPGGPNLALVPLPAPAERRQEQRHAARVGLGLLVPGVLLLLVGHPELILYAFFGSVTGMYGRLESPLERFRHQFHGAGMLVTGTVAGVLLAHQEAQAWLVVCCVTAFATAGSVLTDRLRLRPGGPFFGIFALGATATVGSELVTPWVAIAICVLTAGFSLALGLAIPLLAGGRLAPPSVELRERSLPAGARTHALRYALATGAAGLVGLGLGIDHANWAMAAAAVPLAVVSVGEQLNLRAVVERGMQRLTGTATGLLVTALVLVPQPSASVLGAAVILLLFPTELFMSRHHGVALGFFTPLIMIMTELADPDDPVTMLVSRGLDTLIGVAAGVAAAALVAGPRRPSHRARVRVWAG